MISYNAVVAIVKEYDLFQRDVNIYFKDRKIKIIPYDSYIRVYTCDIFSDWHYKSDNTPYSKFIPIMMKIIICKDVFI